MIDIENAFLHYYVITRKCSQNNIVVYRNNNFCGRLHKYALPVMRLNVLKRYEHLYKTVVFVARSFSH